MKGKIGKGKGVGQKGIVIEEKLSVSRGRGLLRKQI